MIKKESGLYEPIQRWLQKQGYMVEDGWINKGGAKYRVDVIGVKNSGNKFYDDIEIVAVEAKLWGNFKDLGQTENYRDFAHKVYFATTSESTADWLKQDCFRKNLGLLVVDKKTDRVKELITAQVVEPKSEAQMIEFLRKIWIGKCTLCGCYFDLWTERAKTITLGSWTRLSKRKSKLRRYLCGECVENINAENRKIADKYKEWLNLLEAREASHHKRIDEKYYRWCYWLEKKIKELKKKS